jgi:septum formation protein
MTHPANQLYLASASPRRRELLEQLGLTLQRIHADIDETPHPGEPAAAYAERLALEKAAAGWHVVADSGLPSHPLLAADTTVTLDGEIFGKPVDRADAARMLKLFSGRTHQVITALAVRQGEQVEHAVSISDVTFRPLTDADIERYLDSGEPFDKAGAYGIQGLAGVFVQHISGSFTGVMGLPLFETAQVLGRFGLTLP